MHEEYQSYDNRKNEEVGGGVEGRGWEEGGAGVGGGSGGGQSFSISSASCCHDIQSNENESTITILLPASEYCSDTCDRASGKFIFCSNMALCEIKTLSKVYAEAGVAGWGLWGAPGGWVVGG